MDKLELKALGKISTLKEGREIVRASFAQQVHMPA